MYLYIKIISNKLSIKDHFAIRTGKKLLDNKFGNHHIFLENLYIEIERSNIYKDNNYFNNLLLPDIEKSLFLSQFFSKDFNTFRFTKAILISIARNKKIVLPISQNSFDFFEKNGLEISKIGCRVLFLLQGISKILFCFLLFFKIIIHKIKKLNSKKIVLKNMFFHLSKENFPYTKNFNDFSLISELIGKKIISKNDYNLVFIKNDLNRTKIRKYIKNKNYKFKFSYFDFPVDLTIFGLIKVFFMLFSISLVSLINIIINNFEYINFSDEIFKFYIVKFSRNQFLPKNFYYNNSTYRFRPLWTYLQKPHLVFYVYFYSISELDYKNKNYDYKLPQSLYNLNWNNYYTWNDLHTNFYKKITKNNVSFYECGSLSLKDSNGLIPPNVDIANSVAVFDAAPYKKIFSMSFAMYSAEYRSYENIIMFLSDITDLSIKYGFNVIYKPKKNDKNQISKFFLNKLKKFNVKNNFYIINENISPKKYIDECICSISFPFTSTAHLNKQKNKSIYYDPTGSIFPDDIGSFGINTINNKKKLDIYIKNLIKNYK